MTWLLVCALVLMTVLAWGPGHHLEFSQRVHRRRREHLPREVSKLLGEERDAYFYGSIAADIINFKAYGGDYNHCHRWSIVEDMRALADSPRDEAFILGYLSHLAADTIAHNHFVPYHLCRFARTKGLGHLYWEMNADRFVPEPRWAIINHLKSQPALAELDELVNRTVPKKALSMTANKLIFNHVLLVSQRDAWRRGMERIHPSKNLKLEKGFLGRFQRAAVDRVRLALRPRGLRALSEVDPNGKAAQKQAVALRRRLVSRWTAGGERKAEAERLAQPFLAGMESPPPSK